jgi:cytochrome c oxidase subunit III
MSTTTLKNKVNNNHQPQLINPTKFVLWLIIVASIMLFAAYTSAYIVRRGEGNWLLFNLPTIFAFTTGIIALSSITMQWALISAKKDNQKNLKTALYVTFSLGVAFIIGQYLGWLQLISQGIHLVGNPAESFVYVISGLHLFHMLGGLGLLIAVLIKTFQSKISAKNFLIVNLCSTFWHFLGAMWIYLYFFLLLNR